MSKIIAEYETETANGSKVRIISKIIGIKTAWNNSTYNNFAYIDELNDTDLKLIKSLNFPNWYFDFTGKGMVLNLHKQEHTLIQIIKALNFKNPWILKTP